MLYAIHRDLGCDPIVVGVDDLRLDPAHITSDVAEFEGAVAAGRRESAARLCTGPFLDGFFIPDAPEFEQWVAQQRQRLESTYGAVLAALAEEAAASGRRSGAVEWWRKRAALEPLNSRVTLGLMNALVDLGDRAGAIQHARVHADLLKQELDVRPDAEVTKLAERLRAEREPTPPPEREPAAAPASPAPSPASAKRIEPRQLARMGGLVAVLAVGAIAIARMHQPEPNIPRAVVLGTIGSSDATLGLAVREALRAELEARGGVRVLSDTRVRETLALMRLPPDSAVGVALALEIAQRRGVPLAIVGSATPFGTGTQLVAQLVDATTGDPIATLTEQPAGAEDLLAAVSRLAATLRDRAVGTRVTTTAAPLPPVTTGSLAALRNYSQAREALLRLDRESAIDLLESALAHDSLFALAHYLVGDVLWYIDQYSHSVVHLTKAFELSDRLPPRERLVVHARYEQLVRDRPDSALAYWRQLLASYPDEPLAYEGVIWAYMALRRPAELAAVAETAVMHNPVSPDIIRFGYTALIDIGDTLGAIRLAHDSRAIAPSAEFSVRLALLERAGRWEEALRAIDSAPPRPPISEPRRRGSLSRHLYLLALGRLDEARREMEAIVQDNWMQAPHRAVLMQAQAEIAGREPAARTKPLVRRGLALIESADIYPPAVARLTELLVTAAARLRDTFTISASRHMILRRDAGRGLHSYTVALATIHACAAFARGDMRTAAEELGRTRPATFHGRPDAALEMLEAEARAGLGERAGADSLYRDLVATSSVWQLFARRALQHRT
jgi:tetratricopeptide (TPR) repeat protein